MELTRRIDVSMETTFFLMEEVHTCQNLSNFNIEVWWSKTGPTDIARELATYKDCCPQSLRENVLAGVL